MTIWYRERSGIINRQEKINKVQFYIKNIILEIELLSSEKQKLNQLSETLKEVLLMLEDINK